MLPSLTTESFPDPASTAMADCVAAMLMLAPGSMLMLSLPDLAVKGSLWLPLHTMVSPCEDPVGTQAAWADLNSASASRVSTQRARRRKPPCPTRIDGGGERRPMLFALPTVPPQGTADTHTTLNGKQATPAVPCYDDGIAARRDGGMSERCG